MPAFTQIFFDHPLVPLFFLANLAIGFWAHRKSKVNSFADYALASKALPTGVLVMTLLGTYLSNGDLGQPDRFYVYGSLHLFTPLFSMISFCLIGTFIAPFLVHFGASMTLGGLMQRFYGRTVQLVAGVLGVLVSLLIIIAQVSTLGEICALLLPIDFVTSVVLLGGLTVLYSLWGGMRAVSHTDILQIILALLLFTWITHKVVHQVGGFALLLQKVAQKDPAMISVLSHPHLSHKLVASFFWFSPFAAALHPPIVHRMLIVQDKKVVRSMWYASAFLLGLIAIGTALIGLSAWVGQTEFGLQGGKNLLPCLIKNLCPPKSLLYDVMFLGIIGILLSTMDSYLHSAGIAIVEDIVGPLRHTFGKRPLPAKQKITYAKLGIACLGFIAVLVGLQVRGSLRAITMKVLIPATFIYAVTTVPLILGILGLKTDRGDWISFCVGYLGTLLALIGVDWKVDLPLHLPQYIHYYRFLVALPAGLIAFFLTNIYRNGGIVTLKRSKQTIAEQLWLPSLQGTIDYLKSWWLAPFQLHILASRKAIRTPAQPLTFSMLIFFLYMLASIMGEQGLALANFMVGLHTLGISLCVGLMLEDIWPDTLKPYFSLYWFFTLGYCLAFSTSMTFLLTHGSMTAIMLWVGSLGLLACLVDSKSFFVLSVLGNGLAWISLRLAGGFPYIVWKESVWVGMGILALIVLGVVLFQRKKEDQVEKQLNWNRTASSVLGHDLRHTVQMLGGAGHVLSNSFRLGKSTKNKRGEHGYWIPERPAKFLEEFSEKMVTQGNLASKEIQDFSNFIEKQVVGIFEQEKVSLRTAAEEAIQKLQDKMPSYVKITIPGDQDFTAKVLAGVLPNMFYNLIWNAASHGKASEIEIRIDALERKIAVWDNGKGIGSDLLPRIFELNFTTGAKRGKNAGVGLAFVKMVVSASSGKISCHSRHGDQDSFTEFIMTFPKV